MYFLEIQRFDHDDKKRSEETFRTLITLMCCMEFKKLVGLVPLTMS
jgi:hypothetical protein